jgi:hypothetical protein
LPSVETGHCRNDTIENIILGKPCIRSFRRWRDEGGILKIGSHDCDSLRGRFVVVAPVSQWKVLDRYCLLKVIVEDSQKDSRRGEERMRNFLEMADGEKKGEGSQSASPKEAQGVA